MMDKTAPHVFPHVRDAIRAWHSWARGGHADIDRPSVGRVRGKGPTDFDCARVGWTIRSLGLDYAQTRRLVSYGLGGVRRSEDRGFQTLVQRVEWNLRRRGVLALPAARHVVRRCSWPDAGGREISTSYIKSTLVEDFA